ncbi:MAG: translation initiation factor IF-2 N-terminal domain-containing protein, partial [Oscillospiraceae bacterium]
MIIKYKISDVAKDLAIGNKPVIDLLAEMTGEVKKHTTALSEDELNKVFEHFTHEAEETSLDDYLNSAPAPKAAPVPKAAPAPIQPKQPTVQNAKPSAPKA